MFLKDILKDNFITRFIHRDILFILNEFLMPYDETSIDLEESEFEIILHPKALKCFRGLRKYEYPLEIEFEGVIFTVDVLKRSQYPWQIYNERPLRKGKHLFRMMYRDKNVITEDMLDYAYSKMWENKKYASKHRKERRTDNEKSVQYNSKYNGSDGSSY